MKIINILRLLLIKKKISIFDQRISLEKWKEIEKCGEGRKRVCLIYKYIPLKNFASAVTHGP